MVKGNRVLLIYCVQLKNKTQVSHPFFGANPLQMASNKIFKGKIMISLPLASTIYDTLELGTAAVPISAVGAVIHT